MPRDLKVRLSRWARCRDHLLELRDELERTGARVERDGVHLSKARGGSKTHCMDCGGLVARGAPCLQVRLFHYDLQGEPVRVPPQYRGLISAHFHAECLTRPVRRADYGRVYG